jgi:signal transduction histidine kinase
MTITEPTWLTANRRILVIDDNPSIQKDFRSVLVSAPDPGAGIDFEAAAVFGNEPVIAIGMDFELDSAMQGDEALRMVEQAREAGRPYAMAFVDMRMPPGWDGLTTIKRIFEVDSAIQAVICTAYSDRSWSEIQATLTERDRWMVLKKPFDKIEVLQLAYALTEKWNLARLAGLKTEGLERMVAARSAELEDAYRVTREFLANANHELLTPMNGVCGLLELVADSELTDDQRLYVEQASQCSADLLRLLRRILAFNRADAGLLGPDDAEFTPAELLDSVVNEHAEAASAKRLTLHTRCGAVASGRWRGPAALIRQTLGLLMDNAFKFTAAGTVSLGCEPSTNGLEFSVTDTGRGMTPLELDWIRIPFAQVDGGPSRESSGMGLGLPLASRFARAMGGTLVVTSAPGQGATVKFTARAGHVFKSAPAT